jgi:flagellar protein FliO/FliZ
MFESVFGAEMPLAVRFFLAFLIVLGLIGATAWAVRRFGSGRLGGAGSRGRQPRLSVTEYARVDPRRQLILVRRDNVEHLVMIGGPTDLVVEPNIVRAVATPRDVSMARTPAVEPLPRAIPLPENGNGSWPLAPEPMTPPPMPRATPKIEAKIEPKVEPKIEPIAEEPAGWPLQPHAEAPPARPQRDTLAALADELSTPPRPTPPPPRNRPPGAPRVPPGPRVDARAEPREEPRAEARPEPRPEPRIPAAQPAAAPATADAGATDQSLAEMAQRLEAALRKSGTPAAALEPAAPPPPAPPPQQSRVARPAEPKPARAESRPNQSTTLIDNLEQEMASLLGRPPNKS